MFCIHCGSQNPDGAWFCNGCGKEVARVDSAPASELASVLKREGKRTAQRIVVGSLVLVVGLLAYKWHLESEVDDHLAETIQKVGGTVKGRHARIPVMVESVEVPALGHRAYFFMPLKSG